MFVVVLSDEGQPLAVPRAVGPFEEYDVALTFSNTLLEKWRVENNVTPAATVVRVEEPLPGVVVGEM